MILGLRITKQVRITSDEKDIYHIASSSAYGS